MTGTIGAIRMAAAEREIRGAHFAIWIAAHIPAELRERTSDVATLDRVYDFGFDTNDRHFRERLAAVSVRPAIGPRIAVFHVRFDIGAARESEPVNLTQYCTAGERVAEFCANIASASAIDPKFSQ